MAAAAGGVAARPEFAFDPTDFCDAALIFLPCHAGTLIGRATSCA